MKKLFVVFCMVFLCMQFSTRLLFAQVVVVVRPATPTPSPTKTMPTPTTVAPTAVPTITPAPTSAPPTPTSVPKPIIQAKAITPTPTLIPTATPTPKQKPLPLSIHIPPPSTPVNTIITAPLNLVAQALPRSYYNDTGLAPRTTSIFLLVAFMCISGGILLLLWPRISRAFTNKPVVIFQREKKEYPFIAERVKFL